MATDYYKTLGVPRNASGEAIKAAYRRCVKRHHPDLHCDHHCHERIREINEAYEVLGNSERRNRYDMDMRAREMQYGASRNKRGDSPGRGWAGRRRETGSGQRHAYQDRPFGESESDRGFYGSILRGIFGLGDYYEIPHELAIYLSPREAYRGIHATIAVTYPLDCTQCRGTGVWYDIIPCAACLGQGYTEDTVPVHLDVPPGAENGEIITARGGFDGDLLFSCRIIIQ